MSDMALAWSRLTAAEARAIEMVLDGLPSEHSRRAYERALIDFFRWHASAGRPALNKSVVQRYAAELRDSDLSRLVIRPRPLFLLARAEFVVGTAAQNFIQFRNPRCRKAAHPAETERTCKNLQTRAWFGG